MAYTIGAKVASGRPRRSVLFVPGSHERAVDKARSSAADSIVLDLEDMVANDLKDSARGQVSEALSTGGFGTREVVVRINGLDTPWGANDIAALASAGADALLLPKVDSADMLAEHIELIDRHGGGKIALWVLAETPRAILDIDKIAAESPRLKAIVMGTEDLIKSVSVGRDPTRLGLTFALSRCVFAARAAGIGVIDGVFIDLKDTEGFAASCRQGALLGFDGKALIHPNQIEDANTTFV